VQSCSTIQVARDRLYRRHRFSAEVIALAVWLYLHFPLSLRMVEDLVAANSHQPNRRRERIMKGFKSARNLQRFVSMHGPVANLFHIPRHDIPSDHRRKQRTAAMQVWNKITRLRAA
jgi:transposase-like protein